MTVRTTAQFAVGVAGADALIGLFWIQFVKPTMDDSEPDAYIGTPMLFFSVLALASAGFALAAQDQMAQE